jgi:hypothetical protein
MREKENRGIVPFCTFLRLMLRVYKIRAMMTMIRGRPMPSPTPSPIASAWFDPDYSIFNQHILGGDIDI